MLKHSFIYNKRCPALTSCLLDYSSNKLVCFLRHKSSFGRLVAEGEVRTTIKVDDQATLKSVIIGSTLKNTGDTDLPIYKGKSTKGDPIIVKPGESWGVLKKYSVITVSNPDTLKAASFTTLRSR